MALNDNYNGGYNKGHGSYSKEDKRPQSYSMYSSMYNTAGVDPSRLSIDYFSNVMKISIAPMVKEGNSETGVPSYDYNNSISVFIRQNEARILKSEIEYFISDPVAFNNSGVAMRSGIITINNGKEYNTHSPCIIIRKVDDNGKVVSSYLYECNTDNMFSIRNYNEAKNTFDKVTVDYQYTELYHIIEHLNAYLSASTNAVAHSVLDNTRFVNNRLNTKIDTIGAAMNIKFGGEKTGGSSYFNKAPATNYSSSSEYKSGSYDDLNHMTDDE